MRGDEVAKVRAEVLMKKGDTGKVLTSEGPPWPDGVLISPQVWESVEALRHSAPR